MAMRATEEMLCLHGRYVVRENGKTRNASFHVNSKIFFPGRPCEDDSIACSVLPSKRGNFLKF